MASPASTSSGIGHYSSFSKGIHDLGVLGARSCVTSNLNLDRITATANAELIIWERIEEGNFVFPQIGKITYKVPLINPLHKIHLTFNFTDSSLVRILIEISTNVVKPNLYLDTY